MTAALRQLPSHRAKTLAHDAPYLAFAGVRVLDPSDCEIEIALETHNDPNAEIVHVRAHYLLALDQIEVAQDCAARVRSYVEHADWDLLDAVREAVEHARAWP